MHSSESPRRVGVPTALGCCFGAQMFGRLVCFPLSYPVFLVHSEFILVITSDCQLPLKVAVGWWLRACWEPELVLSWHLCVLK